ncbi:unnamed protein product [Colias eurytheme]|nr:unnamed protein product [Colias eurytheme]
MKITRIALSISKTQHQANRKFKDITRNRSNLNFGVFPLNFAQRRPQSEGGGYWGGLGTRGAEQGWRLP